MKNKVVFLEKNTILYKLLKYSVFGEIMPEAVGIGGFITGKCTGKAVVIKSYEDLKRVKKGDIIVAYTTDPNYDIAFEDACAVVVEKGNIFSHSVIASRDLKARKGIDVVVVVGVKDITKHIQDGMNVTVEVSQPTRPAKVIW